VLMTSNKGGLDHIVQKQVEGAIQVPVARIDDLLIGRCPFAMKIDVEGFEMNVIKGAQRLLKDSALKAVLMEMNGSGKRYGFDDRALDTEMHRFGFNSFLYEPWSRKLSFSDPKYVLNTVYIRDLPFVEHRLRAAKPFRVLRHQI